MYCPSISLRSFQAVLNPWASMVISLARGVIVSSAMIMLLPMIFPSEALWFAMPVTEVAVAVYGTYAMIKANSSAEIYQTSASRLFLYLAGAQP